MELQNSISGGGTTDPKLQKQRPASPEPSGVSMKSDRSIMNPPVFSSGSVPCDLELQTKRSAFAGPSGVSMKSDRSIMNPPVFSSGSVPCDLELQTKRSALQEPSDVSMKSGRSIMNPPVFSSGSVPSVPEWGMHDQLQDQGSCGLCLHLLTDPASSTCGHSFCRQCISSFWDNMAPSDFVCPQCRKRSRTRPVLHPHNISKEHYFYQPAEDVLHRVSERHKTIMKNKYESLFEGIKTPENRILLSRVYTELYIVEGESEGVNKEHEVLQMEKTPTRHQQDTIIKCTDIFKPLKVPDRGVMTEDLKDEGPEVHKVRSVLTKGIAGIGKTVSVQKFILDWAEGTANQEVDFMFVFPFRELNLIKDDQYSLHGLLCAFHPELRDLDPEIYDHLRAVFIFDGLDESRLPLIFKECEKVSDITMTSSVGVLTVNLIKGYLIPSALIWITSRPAAANQIPPQYVNRVTEVHGFSEPQREEYFRRKIRDQDKAQKIISHIKRVRSLHIMCHIPVFCWISATVLQKVIQKSDTEIPKTLTEIFSNLLLTQTNMKNEKYEEIDERDPKNLLESNRTKLLKLAELAFTQLLKGNVMFYEEDLRECSIDVTEASVYSGIFTEIFREECVIHQRKVYCFVHLSFQEFLAAVFVFHCFEDNIMEPLQCFNPTCRGRSKKVLLNDLLKGAVSETLKSQNGHLDLFLRFLLGISVESNRRPLQGLLSQTKISNLQKTTGYIKGIISRNKKPISTERSINLFLCLSEMNDQSLSREIKDYIKSEKCSEVPLTPGQCSALAYMLLNSEEELDELDLRKYNTSEEGCRRLIPAVTVCRKTRLTGCDLTKDSCESLCSALQTVNSFLKELDLSNNDLQDSGVELLSAGLKSSHCKLEILRLSTCNLGNKACEYLESALQSVNTFLKELDLSNNDLQDSGVEQLSAGLKSPYCKLETLRLVTCNLGSKACEILCSALHSVNCSLKDLDLSNNDLQDSGMEQLSAGLKSSHCKLETLRLSGCMVTEDGCSSLASALKSNPIHLGELDVTYNHPQESGMKMLLALQQDPHCALKNLKMEHGGLIRMKQRLKKYACNLTLDANTAHPDLSVSEGNTKVENVGKTQPCPDVPERFDCYLQVLSAESLPGRCYWEVERSGEVAVSVAYRRIERKGNGTECAFGFNTFSWCVFCADDRYCIRHNNKRTEIPAPTSHSNRVGVYLDWGSGTLSFYTISPHTHTLTHLHTFTSTFTEPLYTGLRVYSNSSVRLCVAD